ncbi:MBL fold metallo-hydrolase [Candidatus Planktophila versatilis]|nr:MBL fold metallo-hydrolase [Candidatus Planktophila versatilis]
MHNRVVKIQWYRSATVGIFSDSGNSILCDPWMTDGAFIGSWYHWPPLEGFEFDFLVSKNWDAIYISHFHADHFDRKLLAAIIRNNAVVKVLIPEYSNKWLRRAVLNCGVTPNNLIEIPNNKSVQFKDFSIRMFVADYCNPQMCGASISCVSSPRKQSANDSVALFEADGQRILNANDALAVQSAQRLWPVVGEVDLLLGHFGGAGPFPQCFADLNKLEKLENAREMGQTFVGRLIETAGRLNAKFTMPYAGQYVLGGSLTELNEYRSVIPLSQVLSCIADSGVTTPVSMLPFGEFNLTQSSLSEEWREPPASIQEAYLEKIKKVLFPYQKFEEDWPGAKVSLNRALQRVKNEFDAYVEEGGSGSISSITIMTEGVSKTINFGLGQSTLSESPQYENHSTIQLDSRLLKRLLIRKAGYQGFTQYHFNQAEIGSHLTWSRKGPYPSETQFLNFLQDIAQS